TNSFKGKIDELRIYSRAVAPKKLRYRAGDLDGLQQQSLTTGKKTFSESINSRSLVLEADVETRGQNVEVIVESQNGASDPIELSNDKERYQIDGLSTMAQNYSLKIEMDSNKTHAPLI
ncbi:MAG: hypothetical protein ABEK04_05385, partial [Candidatus Nanohalobium sp.]